MPLADSIPVIDNRTFAQLNDEVKTRIPRYAPEWTDFNDSDPGIALAQLFAWMTELLTYRLGQVPELNYIKFLELIGIELSPAQPATAQITFPVVSTFTAPYVIVPQHTQVSVASADGSAPIIFETDAALIALSASLAGVQTFDGYSYSDVTTVNQAATAGFSPFGPNAFNGSALLLGFNGSTGMPNVELDLSFWIPIVSSTGPAKPTAISCDLPNTPAYPPTPVVWQYFTGTNWLPMNVRTDGTLAFTRTGTVKLQLPALNTIHSAVVGSISQSLMWIRALLQNSQYAQAPSLLSVLTNTVSSTQAQTIQNEILGGSSGMANQVYQLANTPVLAGSLNLQIDMGDGQGFIQWTEVNDFFGSGPDDTVFVLDRTAGQIRLGDGVNGAIAIANPSNSDANVVANEYRFGGGQVGNVPAGQISTLTTSVTGIDDNGVLNPFASTGGRDEETLSQAKARAPMAIQSRCRAVTVDDFEYLAMQAGNVRRAKALPLFHPDFPTISFPGVVTVIIVPNANTDLTSDQFNPMPTPANGDLRTVCAHLNPRRLLTSELYVTGPTYQQVQIQVVAFANPTADLAAVNAGIETGLKTYFHPLIGGDDGTGWPFGGTIYFSLVYRAVLDVDGVQSITSITIVLDGVAAPPCTDVPIKKNALLYSADPQLNVQYGD